MWQRGSRDTKACTGIGQANVLCGNEGPGTPRHVLVSDRLMCCVANLFAVSCQVGSFNKLIDRQKRSRLSVLIDVYKRQSFTES